MNSQHTVAPVHVESHLTAKGHELEPAIEALVAWSGRWITLPEPAATPGGVVPAPAPGG
ncbi:winged helix-turn-helix transcriptional regulator [Microtetraspora sp. NBRC 16547]|uniref:winged helix-turn-helix transcriptional regulator n=1 Tax=Microtetraspora sp. NBRC 16547 TaxID=3030993 RepID=UPI002556CAE1|nr:winged helix-turn-helix transcriptional regulator [Microtetraspora sp. NBRC 16547]